MSFCKEQAKEVIGSIIATVQESAVNEGVSLRCVGSLGVCSLLGIEPKIFRKRNGLKMECVDSDFIAGWPMGMSKLEIKKLADYWWTMGMSGEKYLSPVSIINLPKEVANDPSAVLRFEWNYGKEFFYKASTDRIVALPLELVEQKIDSTIFDCKIETISPYAHIVIKTVAEYHNPLRIVKDTLYCARLIRKFNLAGRMLKLSSE